MLQLLASPSSLQASWTSQHQILADLSLLAPFTQKEKEQVEMMINPGLQSGRSGLESGLHHLLTKANVLIPLSLSFLVCVVGSERVSHERCPGKVVLNTALSGSTIGQLPLCKDQEPLLLFPRASSPQPVLVPHLGIFYFS